VAKSKSGEFYTFDEVLRQLDIDENRLKRLVSEGEIRAFREGDQMKFKRAEIDNLAGRRGSTSDTSLSEISLEDAPPARKRAGETLTDDLLGDADLTRKGGMRTAEISSQDTFIDQGGDVGMSTEPIDFTEDVGGDEPEEISSDVSAKPRRAPAGPVARRPAAAAVEPRTGALWVFLLVLGTIASLSAGLVALSAAKQEKNNLSGWFAEKFGPVPEARPTAGAGAVQPPG
jgi:excisionase family DNA binding protein